MARPLVDDALRELIKPLLPKAPSRHHRYAGRKPVPDRAALTGIVFVLRSGIPWQMLPQEMGCGSGMTCWRRKEISLRGYASDLQVAPAKAASCGGVGGGVDVDLADGVRKEADQQADRDGNQEPFEAGPTRMAAGSVRVSTPGTRSWLFAYKRGGKPLLMGPGVSLARAKELPAAAADALSPPGPVAGSSAYESALLRSAASSSLVAVMSTRVITTPSITLSSRR